MLVKIARDQTELFELKYNVDPDGKPLRNVLRMNLDLPDEQYPTALDWSYSNLCTLFDIGYRAGLAFCDEHEDALEFVEQPQPERAAIR
jgi:hypothetical protein